MDRDGFDLNKEFDPNIHDSWMRLIDGQTIGKKAVIPLIGGGNVVVPSSITLLNIQSTDPYARQLALTLQPPKFLSNAAVNAAIASGQTQAISGEFDNQVPGFPGIVIANPSVVVDWGIGGTFDGVEADFVNGLCLNIPGASFLRVTCKVDSLNITVDTNDIAYVLSAFVGPGVPKALNAQKTVSLGTFVNINDTSPTFAVPRHSKAVTLVGVQASVADDPGDANRFSGTIQFFRSNIFSSVSMISESFFDEATHFPVNVPNGAIFFRAKNLTPTSIDGLVRASAIFDLSV